MDSAKEFSYKESINELEAILNNIEQNELDVDELSEKLSRASELIKLCKTRLRKAETDVENILKDIEE